VQDIACGKNSGLFMMGATVLVLLYTLLIVTPLVVLSIRVSRYARMAGGCQDDYQPMYHVMPQHAAVGVPVRQGNVVNPAVPVARPVPSAAAAASDAPVAQAVPASSAGPSTSTEGPPTAPPRGTPSKNMH
jgi:hypothetical protein